MLVPIPMCKLATLSDHTSTNSLTSGGGNVNNIELNNAAIPLQWMINQSIIAGLRMETSKVTWDMAKLAEMRPKESMTLPYRLIEIFPFTQLTYEGSTATKL